MSAKDRANWVNVHAAMFVWCMPLVSHRFRMDCLKYFPELQLRGCIEDNSKLIFLKSIYCDASLKPSRRDGSNNES